MKITNKPEEVFDKQVGETVMLGEFKLPIMRRFAKYILDTDDNSFDEKSKKKRNFVRFTGLCAMSSMVLIKVVSEEPNFYAGDDPRDIFIVLENPVIFQIVSIIVAILTVQSMLFFFRALVWNGKFGLRRLYLRGGTITAIQNHFRTAPKEEVRKQIFWLSLLAIGTLGAMLDHFGILTIN